MGKFVDHYVVNYEHGSFNEPPVKTYVFVHSTGTPAVAIVNDPCFHELDTKLAGSLFNTVENRFVGSRDVPIPQYFTPFGLLCYRHSKEVGKLNRTACSLSN